MYLTTRVFKSVVCSPALLEQAMVSVLTLGLLLGTTACWTDEPLIPQSGDDDAGNSGAGGDSSGAGPSGNGSNGSSSTGGTAGPPAPGGYYTDGNTIYDSNGSEHVFRGVARPSLEWNYNGEGLAPGDYQLMASWGANVVRIALNQGFWLEGSVAYAPGYQATVDQNVTWAQEAGLDVILDLHWSDRGNFGQWPEQQPMADPNSVTFWQQVATRYKDNGRVMFELYNEPYDISWSVWKNGGDSGNGFQAVGMQQLYDTVRDAGADNLVIVGGVHWAYDLSGVPSNRIDGYNIVYATHLYNFGDKQPSAWADDWAFLTASDPVMITEFGDHQSCSASYSQQVIDHALAEQLSFVAWAWFPGGCEFPSLIQDWAGTPTAEGQILKAALQL